MRLLDLQNLLVARIDLELLTSEAVSTQLYSTRVSDACILNLVHVPVQPCTVELTGTKLAHQARAAGARGIS